MPLPVCASSDSNVVNLDVVDGILCASLQAHHMRLTAVDFGPTNNPGGTMAPTASTIRGQVGTGTFTQLAGAAMGVTVNRKGLYVISASMTLDSVKRTAAGAVTRAALWIEAGASRITKEDRFDASFPDLTSGVEGVDLNCSTSYIINSGTAVHWRANVSHVATGLRLNSADVRNHFAITLISEVA